MSFKVTFIGAGSIGFTRMLLRDLLSVPEFKQVRISFTDINAENLEMVTALCQRDLKENGFNTEIQATLNRKEALKDARYIFSVVRIGGLEAFEQDISIPLNYGIDQCVGDTLSAGGIMYGQRGIQEMLAICKDIREVAEPNCLLLNHANPMAMLTWVCQTYGEVNTVGLCHGVQGGHRQIATVFGLDKKEVDIVCAGINHQTWYIQIKHNGNELTPMLLDAFEQHPEYSKTEKVRIDMLKRFGYYSTESNGHLSEYVPWYRKRSDEIMDWIDLGTWINGETGGYLRVCSEGRNWFKEDFPNWMQDPVLIYCNENRSEEHGSYIIEALETGRVYRGHFNRVNNGTITNLPKDCVIEAPGYVDRNGLTMTFIGDLPLGCAAVCNASIQVQRLAIMAAVTGDEQLLRQAFMMDPLTGAVCTPPEIWQLVDDLLIAQEEWLPQYEKSIEKAKQRQSTEPRLVTKKSSGAARLKQKTIEELKENRAEAIKNAQAADKANNRPARST
ncbi:alpha-glucosidase/alpha-galactosidase [Shouchella miscanthi]|uniref:alpha-glucosidase/alpha-galactosidase n=1 Tax=Shouchella miscanthi TaxID=2598861 RepID=UPI0011AA5274|nr:alpha-glucosidase/alpha-galactosidase [Shouchella miscanthi]